MSDEPLTPRLTTEDVRVLRALPSSLDLPWPNVWRLGESLDVMTLPALHLTLNGLRHLGYVTRNTACIADRRRLRWARTHVGDGYLAFLDAPDIASTQEALT